MQNRQGPAGQAAPFDPLVDDKDGEALLRHCANTAETRRAALGAGIPTPTSRLFVRNNLPPPSPAILADRDAWQLSVDGVARPSAVTLGELKELEATDLTMVLQCAGNGRSHYGLPLPGTPWGGGAVGCVTFTGARLSMIVDTLGGAAAGMEFVTGTGGEPLPPGGDPLDHLVERSVPVERLAEIVLAWAMNGEPLPLAHGGPLRMVVPGYAGVNSIKYIRRIALTPAQSPAFIQRVRYRIHRIGTEPDALSPSTFALAPQSLVTAPLERVAPGAVRIEGVAFGGFDALAGVEVSVDGGRRWRDAELTGSDLGRYAWRGFAAEMQLGPGRHLLAARARDDRGRIQPEESEPNAGGYSYTGWRGPAVTLEVS